MDAIEGFIQGVRAYTPTHFEPNVSQSFEGVARPIPEIPAVAETRVSTELPSPPPDPLGEVDTEKEHRLEIGGAVNEIVKVIEAGEKVNKGIEGWAGVTNTLAPYVFQIFDWLRNFLPPQ
jgi:hypothetical protein